MKGFRKLGEQLFNLGLTQRLGLGQRHTAGGDATAPTVVITCAQTSPSATTPLNFTFTLSEVATDFAIGDIAVGGVGGTKSNFAGSGTSYTCDIAPTASGVMTVDVAENAFHDAAGNGNIAATQFSFTAVVYTLNDDFITADDNPLTSPRTCEPGPGTLTIVDTGSKLSITGDQLVDAGGGSSWSTDGFYGSALTRAVGLAFLANLDFTAGGGSRITQLGFRHTAALTNALRHAFYFNDNQIYLYDNDGTLIDNYSFTNTTYRIAIILQTIGAVYVIKGGAFTEWTIIWVGRIGNTTPLYLMRTGFAGSQKLNSVRISTLPAPFATDFGVATSSSATPAVNDTITQAADGIVFMTWTAVTGETWDFSVRGTDDNNRWIIRSDQGGSTIKLIEVNAGSETERASAAQTFTNGVAYTLTVFCFGNKIRAYIADASKWNYASAAFNNTATIVKTNKAGTNLVAYPKTLSGAAVSVLTAANP